MVKRLSRGGGHFLNCKPGLEITKVCGVWESGGGGHTRGNISLSSHKYQNYYFLLADIRPVKYKVKILANFQTDKAELRNMTLPKSLTLSGGAIGSSGR